MLLCRDDASNAPSVKVLRTSPPTPGHTLFAQAMPTENVFRRLQRAPVPSLSSPAFDTVVSRVSLEGAACTFTPHINHTHDDALRRWCGDSDVFERLYGHARCLQAQRLQRCVAKTQAEAKEVDTLHERFRSYSFPYHLYNSTEQPRNSQCLSTADCACRGSCSENTPTRELAVNARPHENSGQRHLLPRRRRRSHIASPLTFFATDSEHREQLSVLSREEQRSSTGCFTLLSPLAAQKADQQLERMRAAHLKKCANR